MLSSISTAVIAAVVGGGLAAVAAFGVVASQESAGSDAVDSSSISYDG
ncbi:hypothetical protein [Aeromicrobium wangtongii]|uniref:DUF2613 family protein n=1 Tax=Aeromicrobium wangtongii TaxID=2969247 RepID=A0ABY5MD91_9ACTN|nr:hypothetical protein [Aeromicrobium wangtongii]MCD9197619.1 hypothetical protein [Aeromicrobium wangtongii]UUP15108.1 hypothetical protein NQV15_07290 [Aeromicrobium wangtongii]